MIEAAGDFETDFTPKSGQLLVVVARALRNNFLLKEADRREDERATDQDQNPEVLEPDEDAPMEADR
jgi:hypothetical protein